MPYHDSCILGPATYINLVSFVNIPFEFLFLQTFKTPEAVILGLFLSVF